MTSRVTFVIASRIVIERCISASSIGFQDVDNFELSFARMIE